MSTLQEAVAACRLDDALDIAKAGVLDDPEDVSARALLVELLCVKGDWQRASGQRDVIRIQSVEHRMLRDAVGYVKRSSSWRKTFIKRRSPVIRHSRPIW